MNSRISNRKEHKFSGNKILDITQSKQQKEKKGNSLRDLYDTVKHTNICIIRIPGGEEWKWLKMY